MNKLTIFICIFFFVNIKAFANVDVIENNYKLCVKNSNGSMEMAACAEKASDKIELEMVKLLNQYPNLNQSFQTNQNLWEEYKKTTISAICKPLSETLGWDYEFFAKENIYYVNKLRLDILKHMLANAQYPTTSAHLKMQITEFLNTLSKTMPEEKYKLLIKNQNAWNKYKTDLETLLVKSNYKNQIIQNLYEERSFQLWSLTLIYNSK